jgi:hypothetical protein
MERLQIGVTALVIALGLPLAAHAQTTFSPDRAGWEFGQSVATGRDSGELAMYVGATQGNNLIAFRAGVLDETDTVPCSIGVMYQYILHATHRFASSQPRACRSVTSFPARPIQIRDRDLHPSTGRPPLVAAFGSPCSAEQAWLVR